MLYYYECLLERNIWQKELYMQTIAAHWLPSHDCCAVAALQATQQVNAMSEERKVV